MGLGSSVTAASAENPPPKEYSPHFGFKGERKERPTHITIQELKALQIKPRRRDYCAHIVRDIIACRRKHKFLPTRFCGQQLEALEHCKVEDYIHGLKEQERKKRLKKREELLAQKKK